MLECAGIRKFYTPPMESIYGNWLIVFESQLKCAGMCTPIDYYLFIGTDQGSPKYSCQVAIT